MDDRDKQFRSVFENATVDDWKAALEEDSRRNRAAHAQRIINEVAARRATRSYERRLWVSMLGRGILAAYLLGLMFSLGEFDPRNWQPFAGICSFSFLIGWIVMMHREPKA